MGLDQYLIRKRKHGRKGTQVAYWRKANQIQNYIVTHFIQDEDWNGDDFLLTKDQLIEISNQCKAVLSAVHLIDGTVHNGNRLTETNEWEPILEPGKVIDHPDVCAQLLPTVDGFFFGSLDYDEYYYRQLEETVAQIDDVLNTTDFAKENVYYAAWW